MEVKLNSTEAKGAVRRRLDRVFSRVLLIRNSGEETSITNRLRLVAKPTTVGFLNAHGVNLCWRDDELSRAFADCDLLLRDGVGMKYLCRLIGLRPGLNMNGTDYIPKLLRKYRHRRIAIFGTRRPQLDAAIDRLRAEGIEIVLNEDGFHPDKHYAKLLEENPVSLVLLAMGMPRQEQCAAYLKRHVAHPCVIICGGAVVDFMAGKVSRAPAFLREFGLEWAYRLLCEPRRLFSRYITGGAVFLARLMRLRLAGYRPAPFRYRAKFFQPG